MSVVSPRARDLGRLLAAWKQLGRPCKAGGERRCSLLDSNSCPGHGAQPFPFPCRSPGKNTAAWSQQCRRRAESKAAALNFSPQLLRPESGRQEVVSTGKEEGEFQAGQRLRALCPRPFHASPGTVSAPNFARHLARPLTSRA